MTTNGELTEDQVRERVEALVIEAGSLRALARQWKINASFICDFLNRRHGPGLQIIARLGLVKAVRYAPVADKGRSRHHVRNGRS